MKVTTADYFATDIREGDKVRDKFGREYVAQTDAAWDSQFQEYGVIMDSGKWATYSATDIVTVEYVEVPEYSY